MSTRTTAMHIRIGTNPIAWSNDDLPELGGDTPLETCLAEARQAGFSGIELGRKFPREATALRAALAPFDLELISGWYGAQLRKRPAEDEIRLLAPHLDLLTAMGSSLVIFCEVSDTVQDSRTTPVADRPVLAEAEWRLFTERLTAVAQHLGERGLRLAYHHHMGTVIQQADEVHRLMEETPSAVGLLLDTGHLTFAGDDPRPVAQRWANRIVHVHAKDVRPGVLDRARAQRLTFVDAVVAGVFTVPGDGCIDFRTALEPLAAHGYAGWMVVEAEQDPAKAEPLRYASMGYAHLSKVAEELGFTIDR